MQDKFVPGTQDDGRRPECEILHEKIMREIEAAVTGEGHSIKQSKLPEIESLIGFLGGFIVDYGGDMKVGGVADTFPDLELTLRTVAISVPPIEIDMFNELFKRLSGFALSPVDDTFFDARFRLPAVCE